VNKTRLLVKKGVYLKIFKIVSWQAGALQSACTRWL